MPRSPGVGLSKHYKACHRVKPNHPISAPTGAFSWPSKAQAVLDPACPWLPVGSWPALRLLSRGLSPLREQVRLRLAPKHVGQMPAGPGSPWRRPGLPPGARSPAPQQAQGEGTALPSPGDARAPARGHHVGTPGALGIRNQPRGLLPVRPYAGPKLA